MRKWGWHRANEQPCGTETKPIIKCYWGWKVQLNPFLKRWIRSHTHIYLSPSSLHPESYFETILHKPDEGLHPSAIENLCVAVPRELNRRTMTTKTTRLPPILPPQRKGWPCIHAAVNSVSYSKAQSVTGLSPLPQKLSAPSPSNAHQELGFHCPIVSQVMDSIDPY